MKPRTIPFVLLAAILAALPLFAAQQPNSSTPLPLDPRFQITTIPIWNGTPPGSNGSEGPIPTLTVFPPAPRHENGTAVIIAPGGAYIGLAMGLEGSQVAEWFAARGVTAFVLRYRLGAHNLFPIPLEDAQRAIRLVRYDARKYHISPDRIGMMGFSAGGHLAASAGTLFDAGNPNASDPVDRVSSRPDFMVLGYAWLNAMQPNDKGFITYCSVLKVVPAADCQKFETEYTPALHVTADTPPTFIYATSDDKTVPVQASVDFYLALVKAGVPVEMHLFQHGAHGSGLGSGSPSLDQWPVLLEEWLRQRGLLTRSPASH
jgi:acetyl esterase/lipase